MNFGERLNLLISIRGLHKTEIAKNINVAPNTLSGYLQNNRHPDYSTLKRLARYLGTSTDYLLGLSSHESANHSQLSDDEEALVDMYRYMSPEGKEMFMDIAKISWKHYKDQSCDLNNLS